MILDQCYTCGYAIFDDQPFAADDEGARHLTCEPPETNTEAEYAALKEEHHHAA